MKVFSVLAAAAGIVFLSGIISSFLLPMIPGIIISILLLAGLFFSGIVKPDQTAPVSSFFLENLSFFLVPAFAGCADLAKYTGNSTLKILFLIVAATIIVMTVTGVCAEVLIKIFYKNENNGGANG